MSGIRDNSDLNGGIHLAPSANFAASEEAVLDKWTREDSFQQQVEATKDLPPFTFYDGPPFATGLPHYGHILAGTMKDVVTRYAVSLGHSCDRRFGWDCHGLPVEYEIDKDLGITSRNQVLEMGIDKYNAACRSIVMRYSTEWEHRVKRLGRWIDFERAYKTMNPSFMESVWNVFGRLFKQGYVYRGFKVMPYSTKCATPLSNFEANQAYKDTQDPAVVVTFPIKGDADGACLVAWTTTPWTLPSNLALCVHPELEYVRVKDTKTGKVYVLMESRLGELFKAPKKAKKGAAAAEKLYEVLDKFTGKKLEGTQYEPLFDCFADKKASGALGERTFTVLSDTYVTADAGTGVVHQAPAFGEDDYRVCSAFGVITKGGELPCPVDADGRFTAPVLEEFVGMHVKDADAKIIKYLKNAGRLVSHVTLMHSYPFCWRSDTPLIYRAVPSFFIKVEDSREKLLANNEKTTWNPSHVRDKRFTNWLANARDWAVSRNRFWGTPIPIWVSDDGEEMVCISSIAELRELSGRDDIGDDLHRESIDDITIPSKQGKGVLRRVEEVFDCWFESGSMPYAQVHYPFDMSEEEFAKRFPADFIAEGIDQTRGWFYTLLVLSTLLFDKPPFKHVSVNGLVLASDGKKMSKRLKNYPDPMIVVNSYGADALRLYLINSPVVHGDNLRFREDGVREVVKDVLLPWYNAYRFFSQAASGFEGGYSFPASSKRSDNMLDRWILASVQSLVAFVRSEMDAYHLHTVVPRLVLYIEQLTNWYVRLNRPRLKAGEPGALDALFSALMTLCKCMAPFTPFLAESMYSNLRAALPVADRLDSVHLTRMPEVDKELEDVDMERAVARMQEVIELGRRARENRKLPVKTPLKSLTVLHPDQQFLDDVQRVEEYVLHELNVKQVKYSAEVGEFIELSAQAASSLGRKLRKDFGRAKKGIAELSSKDIAAALDSNTLVVDGITLNPAEDITVTRTFKGDAKSFEAASSSTGSGVLVLLDTVMDAGLRDDGLVREVQNRIQRARKAGGMLIDDFIHAYISVGSTVDKAAAKEAPLPTTPADFSRVLSSRHADVSSIFNGEAVLGAVPVGTPIIYTEQSAVFGVPLEISFVPRRVVYVEDPALKTAQYYVASLDYDTFVNKLGGAKSWTGQVDGKRVTLTNGKDYFLSPHQLPTASKQE